VARAADLAGTIEALGLDRPIVGGHSMGADAAVHLAAARPELARGVFLEDPPLLTPNEPVFGGEIGRRMGDAGKMMARFMSIFRYMPAGAGRALARRMSPTYPDVEIRPWVDAKRRVSRDFLRTMASGAVTMETSVDTLRQVTAPGLLIIGERDAGAIVSEQIAAEAAASMPNLQVVHLAGANHDIRRARFDAYMQALRHFVDRTYGPHGTA
jgi:pimeloyl-ACP methyl ester carboxylesterase